MKDDMAKEVNKKKTTSKKRPISKNVREAFDAAPEIGRLWTRWYDVPYKFSWWLLRGWPRALLPGAVRAAVLAGLNNLLQFNEHDRNKVWSKTDSFSNLFVPEKEHIAMPSVWVVELFSPNEIPNLERAIAKNGWDNQRRDLDGKGNVDTLNRSRAGKGYLWWRLARLMNVAMDEKKYYIPDAKKEKLPDQFISAHLKAIQIDAGLTAVVVRFNLTDEAAASLDEVWHKEHEPLLVWRGGRVHPQNRKFAAFHNVQQARLALHDAARGWMSKSCPGFFATNNEAQLVMDLLLTTEYDPTAKELPDRDFLDALRALGIDGSAFQRTTAEELPGMLFMQADTLYPKILDSTRTWGLIGNRESIRSAFDDFKYYGGDADRGAAYYADEYAAKTLLMLAVSELLSVLENRYATLRDRAKLQNGAFRVGQLKNLSESLLGLSLTLSSTKHDLKKLEKDGWWLEGADFKTEYAPHITKKLSDKPRSMSKGLQDAQLKKLERLTEADNDYRNILATVASLGATANTIKLGRWALAIAALSLVVALVTLVVQMSVSRPETTLTSSVSRCAESSPECAK